MSDEPMDQTVKKKRSRVPARELHALVEDNNQRSSRNLPKCSLCQQRIEPRYWQLHYDYELGRLNETDSDLYTNPSDKTKGKRGAAVLARQHMEKKHKKQRPGSVYEEMLEKVKHNASQRKDTLRQLDSPIHDDMEISNTPLLNDGQGEQTCFICNQQLYGDSDAVNLHIDRCLMNINDTTAATGSSSSATSSTTAINHSNSQSEATNQWDEYEWAGQIRVRATSMMEGGYGGAGFATSKKEDDVEEDLDIEDDDVEYGHSQYNERDIMINSDDDNEDTNALREMVSGGVARRSQASDDNGTDSPQYQFEETVSDAGWTRHLMEHSNQSADIPPSTTGNLVMDSLKSRIHELELASRSVPRCLICLEAYKTPLTSIVCWHVHCEKCWLQTLGSKKLCPQCQKITTPADLRRIYL